MPKQFISLYDICLLRIAYLLRNSYWDSELPLSENPFRFLPSTMIDKLLIYVTRIEPSRPLLSSDLKLLTTSGQVRKFILEDDEHREGIDLDEENFQRILMDLSSSCQNLLGIKINLWWYEENLPIVTNALNYLLSVAQNVMYIESWIEFDLHILRSCVHLQKLVLHFPVKGPMYQFLEVNGQLTPHTTLRHFEVYEDEKYQMSYLETAAILTYCTELIYINCDISKSLEHLHSEQLHNGSLVPKYKIQKCHLGSDDDYVPGENLATKYGVLIALVTCPDLQDIKIYTNDVDAITALGECQSLTTLSIKLKQMPYNFGVQSLLEKPGIGCKLKSLELKNLFNVDFFSVGKYCPNLEELRVYYGEDCGQDKYIPYSFRKLHSLSLFNIYGDDCKIETLYKILCNATNIKDLTVVGAGQLTDEVLEDLLRRNNLFELKNLCICGCGLSLRGIQNLANSLRALESFDVSANDFDYEEIVDVVKEINPHVIMKFVLF